MGNRLQRRQRRGNAISGLGGYLLGFGRSVLEACYQLLVLFEIACKRRLASVGWPIGFLRLMPWMRNQGIWGLRKGVAMIPAQPVASCHRVREGSRLAE